MDDTFTLYDLKVEVIATDRPMVCSHKAGDYFLVQGENLVFPKDTSFSMYSLSALLPVLPAKQRPLDPNVSETTKEEREAIVAESLGNIEATCDGCMSGLAEMYQDYIDGKKELREINMEFNARYVHGEDMPGRSGCGYK